MMELRQTLRVVTAYYWVISVFVLYFGVISPLYEFVTQPTGFNIDTIPVIILPSCVFVCMIVLAARGLSSFSTWGYGLFVATQLVSLLMSLIAFLLFPVFGLVFGAINAVVLLLLLGKSEEREMVTARNAPQFAHARRNMLINRALTGFLIFSCLVLLGWCGFSEYTAQTMAGYPALIRLAGITDRSVTSERLRHALLDRVPVGTSQDTIESFLEANGVPPDRFVGGQFVRYQTGPQYILALFSSPPWVIELFCSQYHGGVRFVFDGNGKLEDIIVENYAYCL